MNIKQHEELKLTDKIYLNSYECMWNDAMTSSRESEFLFVKPKNK